MALVAKTIFTVTFLSNSGTVLIIWDSDIMHSLVSKIDSVGYAHLSPTEARGRNGNSEGFV